MASRSPTLLLAIGVCLLLPPAAMARPKNPQTCTVAQTKRIDPAKEMQCIVNGGTPKCTSERWYCCYPKQGGGQTCTPRTYTSRLDPGGPKRPPRAGGWGSPPDRVAPPAGPTRPPRMDPGPGRIGPPAGPRPAGPAIK